jgi:hypothetical protein
MPEPSFAKHPVTHYYAFMTMRPCEYSKAGRELTKNLKNNTTTFVPFCREGEDVYMELKPFLNKQQRIERCYTGVTLYQDEDLADSPDPPETHNVTENNLAKEPALSGVPGTDEIPRGGQEIVKESVDNVYEDFEFETLIREIDETRQEWYSLWSPSVYSCKKSI